MLVYLFVHVKWVLWASMVDFALPDYRPSGSGWSLKSEIGLPLWAFEYAVLSALAIYIAVAAWGVWLCRRERSLAWLLVYAMALVLVISYFFAIPR